MNTRTVAAVAASAIALIGIPATSSAAPKDPAKSPSTSVGASTWGSYVVVMKGDPLTASIAPGALDSAVASARADAMTKAHDAVVKRAGVPANKKLNDYTAVVNGFSVLASRGQAQKIAKDPDVLLVVPDELHQKQAAGDDQITPGAGQTLQQFLGTDVADVKGDGELLGVIDTGIWPEHPSFADDGSYPKRSLRDARGGFKKCDFGRGKNDANFTCNNKLIGARAMMKTYHSVVGVLPGEYKSARDDDGHGTHTASTAAGNADVRAWTYDQSRTLDTISGVAPRAQIVAYKALGSLGGFGSDLAAAIDQAVYDGVDVINYSVGGGPGLIGADTIAFLNANRAGVHVATSAGNSGPGAQTIGGPADVPWVTTVGASTQPRFYAGLVRLGDGTEVRGSSVTLGSEMLPFVDAKALGNEFCLDEGSLGAQAWARFAAGAKDAMVLCWRGQSGRSIKSFNVKAAGGKAMILSNVVDTDNYFTDNFRLPTVMVDKTEGDILADYAATEGATAQIVDTGDIRTFGPAPSMAAFSSRGPNPSAASIIKPDITAPGVQVLAGASPTPVGDDFEPGQLFQSIAGTSMSSPVMAGVFLLGDQKHPTWSPAALKSAVMTTAHQDVSDNDRTTPADPFDFGSGHVSAMASFNPGLVYDAGYVDFLGFLCGTSARTDAYADPDATCGQLAAMGVETTAENLNYPTIGLAALAGTATVKRTVTNVSGATATFTATVENPPGITMTVAPETLTLSPGEKGTYTVTIDNDSAPVNDGWLFGSVTWTGAGTAARSNVAVYPTPVQAPALATGSGASGSVSIAVQMGQAGTYVPTTAGLAGNDPISGTVVMDPDQTFDPGDATGTTALPITIADATAYARWSLVIPGSDDIDLYLYKDGEKVAESTAGGTNELIELSHPEAGEYTLYVHGWQVAGTRSFSMDQWRAVTGVGALTATPASAEVDSGDVVTVDATWTDAPTGVSYGVVDHVLNGEVGGQTVIQVTS